MLIHDTLPRKRKKKKPEKCAMNQAGLNGENSNFINVLIQLFSAAFSLRLVEWSKKN